MHIRTLKMRMLELTDKLEMIVGYYRWTKRSSYNI